MRIRSFPPTAAILLGLAVLGPGLGCLEPQHKDFLEHASPDITPKGNPATNPATGPENPPYIPD
jgi:hypothetical protein